MARVRVFIGSSSEALPVAEEIKRQLKAKLTADVETWTIFSTSTMILQSVLSELQHADFAVMIATPDNLTLSRGEVSYAPHYNVIAEIGMAMGFLGSHRVFVVHPEEPKLAFGSDFDGFLRLSYVNATPAMLATVVRKIVDRVRTLGPKSNDALLANARVISHPDDNYNMAKKLLRRGFRERLVIYEVSDSENRDDYEDEWRKLVQKVNPARAPWVYRLFDLKGAKNANGALEKWADLSEMSNESWFDQRLVDWPVDLLILATKGGDAVEALVGMSNADRDRWMAVNTTNEKWIALLIGYAEVARSLAPRRPIKDVVNELLAQRGDA